MRKVLLIVLSIMISVAFISMADAATKEKSMKVTGDVVSNDNNKMVVKGPSGEQTFDVAGVKNINKYKPGDNVTITYKEKDGQATAAKISKNRVMKGETKKETKESAEKPSKTEQ